MRAYKEPHPARGRDDDGGAPRRPGHPGAPRPIDVRGYKACGDLRGVRRFPGFVLHDMHVKVADERTRLFGERTVALPAPEQVVCRGQVRAVGHATAWVRKRVQKGRRSVPEVLHTVEALLDREGLDALPPFPEGDLSRCRRFDLAAALNRLRSLRVVT